MPAAATSALGSEYLTAPRSLLSQGVSAVLAKLESAGIWIALKRATGELVWGWPPETGEEAIAWAGREIGMIAPEVDAALRTHWRAKYRREWYHWYLKTDEWDKRRRAVLKRARYTCEGCGRTDKPLQVHHETYEHVGNEFLWELQAVCDGCHERRHEMLRRHVA